MIVWVVPIVPACFHTTGTIETTQASLQMHADAIFYFTLYFPADEG